MSADPTTAPRPHVPANDPEAPLVELAAKYPDFDWKEAAADRFWLNEQQLSGALDAFYGKVVAVYQKEVVGVGDDYIQMLLELSPKLNVHPGRIVVVYLGE
jgi:hypothetical protein